MTVNDYWYKHSNLENFKVDILIAMHRVNSLSYLSQSVRKAIKMSPTFGL